MHVSTLTAWVFQKWPGRLLPQQGCGYSWSLSAGAGRTSLARGAVPAGILPDVVRQTILGKRPWDVRGGHRPQCLLIPPTPLYRGVQTQRCSTLVAAIMEVRRKIIENS